MMTPGREFLLRGHVCNAVPYHNLELISMTDAYGSLSIAHRAVVGDERFPDATISPGRGAGLGDRHDARRVFSPGSPTLNNRAISGIACCSSSRDGKKFRRILVAYDGSPQAERAVETAFSLAGLATATMLVLAVMKPAEPDDSADFQTQLHSARKRYEDSFAAMREQARTSEIDLGTRIVVGSPAAEIVSRAEVMRADLIVMGRHGRSAIRRRMLGSNSERVIQNAQCPVLLVH